MSTATQTDALVKRLVTATYRTGDGVPDEEYGADVREGIAALNRPQFHDLLATDAGFSRVDRLPIEHEFWRFYHLHP